MWTETSDFKASTSLQPVITLLNGVESSLFWLLQVCFEFCLIFIMEEFGKHWLYDVFWNFLHHLPNNFFLLCPLSGTSRTISSSTYVPDFSIPRWHLGQQRQSPQSQNAWRSLFTPSRLTFQFIPVPNTISVTLDAVYNNLKWCCALTVIWTPCGHQSDTSTTKSSQVPWSPPRISSHLQWFCSAENKFPHHPSHQNWSNGLLSI